MKKTMQDQTAHVSSSSSTTPPDSFANSQLLDNTPNNVLNSSSTRSSTRNNIITTNEELHAMDCRVAPPSLTQTAASTSSTQPLQRRAPRSMMNDAAAQAMAELHREIAMIAANRQLMEPYGARVNGNGNEPPNHLVNGDARGGQPPPMNGVNDDNNQMGAMDPWEYFLHRLGHMRNWSSDFFRAFYEHFITAAEIAGYPIPPNHLVNRPDQQGEVRRGEANNNHPLRVGPNDLQQQPARVPSASNAVTGGGRDHVINNGGGGPRRKNATRETTSILKAWLNEHKRNPYPTKSEKIMLAIMTKMSLTQVSTWFANARRRLKKENRAAWQSSSTTTTSSHVVVDSNRTRGSNSQGHTSSTSSPSSSHDNDLGGEPFQDSNGDISTTQPSNGVNGESTMEVDVDNNNGDHSNEGARGERESNSSGNADSRWRQVFDYLMNIARTENGNFQLPAERREVDPVATNRFNHVDRGVNSSNQVPSNHRHHQAPPSTSSNTIWSLADLAGAPARPRSPSIQRGVPPASTWQPNQSYNNSYYNSVNPNNSRMPFESSMAVLTNYYMQNLQHSQQQQQQQQQAQNRQYSSDPYSQHSMRSLNQAMTMYQQLAPSQHQPPSNGNNNGPPRSWQL